MFRKKKKIEEQKLEEQKKKIEEEDIKHMVKLKEERLEIQSEKKEAERQAVFDNRVAELEQKHNKKIQDNLESQKNDVKEMFGQILKRLPDVNVRLKGDV